MAKPKLKFQVTPVNVRIKTDVLQDFNQMVDELGMVKARAMEEAIMAWIRWRLAQ